MLANTQIPVRIVKAKSSLNLKSKTLPYLFHCDENCFSDVDLFDKLEPISQRRTPIAVTVADAQLKSVEIQQLLEAGMNILKIKLSHITTDEKIHLLGRLDKAVARCCKKFGLTEWPVATCIDLKTRVVRTGLLDEDASKIFLRAGKEVVLTCNAYFYDKCNESIIYVNNSYLVEEINIGQEISIAEEEIVLKCREKIDKESIKCIITKGGDLKNLKNVCIRGGELHRPDITKHDLQIIDFAISYQVDIININYIRNPRTIAKIKKHMSKHKIVPLLFCGICTMEGVKNIDAIIRDGDVIVFQRTYLPFELDESLRFRWMQIEQWIGAKCQAAGKPFFISGGIFKSALQSGNPSASDISDVTHSIFRGVTGFVFDEFEDGNVCVKALNGFNEICKYVEPMINSAARFWRLSRESKLPLNAAEACILSCLCAARQMAAKIIILPTITGKTATSLFWLQPPCPVITVSKEPRVIRLLHTYGGIYPLRYSETSKEYFAQEIESRVMFALDFAVKKYYLNYADPYVTLQRCSETSSFCDSVFMSKCVLSREPLVSCPEDYQESTDNIE